MRTIPKVSATVNMAKVAQAFSVPGIDPSCWVSLGSVDADEDAISWEPGTGWIVDVTLHGGKLDQVPNVPCRVASGFSSSNEAASCPLNPGDEVLVAMPGEGDPNMSPTVFARLANTGSSPVPTTIFSSLPEVVDETFVKATFFVVTTKDAKLQFGQAFRVDAEASAGVHAQDVTLADPSATQAFVRGTEFAEALSTFLDGCSTFSATAVTAFEGLATAATGPLAPLKTAFVALGTAFARWGGTAPGFVSANGILVVPAASSAAGVLKATLVPGQALSERIRGE